MSPNSIDGIFLLRRHKGDCEFIGNCYAKNLSEVMSLAKNEINDMYSNIDYDIWGYGFDWNENILKVDVSFSNNSSRQELQFFIQYLPSFIE